jgi:hypothetical protein
VVWGSIPGVGLRSIYFGLPLGVREPKAQLVSYAVFFCARGARTGSSFALRRVVKPAQNINMSFGGSPEDLIVDLRRLGLFR